MSPEASKALFAIGLLLVSPDLHAMLLQEGIMCQVSTMGKPYAKIRNMRPGICAQVGQLS